MTFQVGSSASVDAGLAPTDGSNTQQGRCLGAAMILRRCGDADPFPRWRRPVDYMCRVGDSAAREQGVFARDDLIHVRSHVLNVRHCASEQTVGRLHNVPLRWSPVSRARSHPVPGVVLSGK